MKNVIRIALVADIHGNLAALEAVAADIHRRGVDRILNLGDNLSGPLLPRETAQFLMEEDWISLAGNHERQLLTEGPGERCASDEYAYSQLTSAELKWLRMLPAKARLSPGIYGCHGTPSSDSEYLLDSIERGRLRPANSAEIETRLGDERYSLIACGHSHTPRAVRTSRGQLVVNPGSVGLPAYDDVLPVPHVVETGSPDARYAIVERVKNNWTVSHYAVPYDFKSMAKLARLRGRPEWERALLTGYLS